MIRTNKPKVVYSLFLMLAAILSGTAQNDSFIPSVIPPYPASADLGNYGNVPVGLHRGTANLNLDIYTLKEGGLTVPVSASYNSNGVQVDGISKQLGVDWSLVTGGVISRQVNDQDDLSTSFYSPDPLSDFCGASTEAGLYIGSVSGIDSQKDIFSYSVAGLSGKFFFDGSTIRQIDQSDTKIALSTTVIGGTTYRIFTITDLSGTEYTFGGPSTVEKTISQNLCGTNGYITSNHDTAWYLTKIRNIAGEEATFTYNTSTFKVMNVHQEANLMESNGILVGDVMVKAPCSTKETHTAVYISQIQINDKKIIFDYDTLLIGLEESVQLSHVRIFSAESTLYKSFDFNYFPILANKRVFLKEIIENSPAPVTSITKYAFDYYNYASLPLRNSFAKDIYGYYNGATGNTNLLYNNLKPFHGALYEKFKTTGSNRTPNVNTVYYGMLKSITYPTKGKTEFIYEPNTVYIDKWIFPAPVTIQIGSEANSQMTNEVFSQPFPITFIQYAKVYASAERLSVGPSICETEETYPWDESCTASVKNTTTGQPAGGVTGDKDGNEEIIRLEPGVHTFSVKSIRMCLQTDARLTYYPEAPYTIKVNEPVAGVRIQKTLDYDNNGNVVTKKYIYADFEHPDFSSGEFSTMDPSITPNLTTTTNATTNTNTVKAIMTSGSRMPLSSFDGSMVTYPVVIESFGENFENGGVIHRFSSSIGESAVAMCQDYIAGTPYSNTFGGGNPLSNVTFKKSGTVVTPLQSETFTYGHSSASDYKVDNYTGSVHISLASLNTVYKTFKITGYEVRSQRHYLSSKKVITYDLDGLNPVENIENYNYAASNHLQLTSTTNQTSFGETRESRFYYPVDFPADPLMIQLKAANRIGTAVKTETYLNGTKQSEQRTVFVQNATTANKIMPSDIYAARFPNFNPLITNVGNLERKITFNKYDAKGNILQYTTENGMPVTFIWGYNSTKPLAKIDNATFAQLLSALGMTETVLQSLTEVPANIRTLLPLAQVTSFTYKPLAGIVTVIDPKGDKSTYDYDVFGRLQFVKDKQGNLLSETEYHYRTN